MKRMFFEMPIVAMVVMMSVVCSCGNSGNANQDQSPTDSVVDESAGMEDADVDAKMIEKRLYEMLTKLITKDGVEYLPEYFTEGFNTFYIRACEKADKEGMERPRIWWEESEDDPNQFTIKSVKAISGDEARSDVELKGDLLTGIYEVSLKKEKDNWLIDKVTEKDNHSLDYDSEKESINHEDVCKYLKGFYTEYCKTFFNDGNVNKLAKDNLTEKLYKEYKNGYQPDEVGYTTDIILAIIMGSGGMIVPDRCQNINVKRGDGDYIVEALYESEFGGEKRSQTTYHVKVVEEDGRFLISEIESDEEGNIHD